MLVAEDPTTRGPPRRQLADILRVCSDRISINILTAIETADSLNIRATGPHILEELEITRKQFYGRTHKMIQQRIVGHGLKGTYVLTTLGKIIIGNVFALVNTCIENINELQVIDGIDRNKMSAAEFTDLVNKLIADPLLRDILK